MSYYRIQSTRRPVEALLEEGQLSRSYNTGTARPGKSVCWDMEELAEYLAQVGIPFDSSYIVVELEGEHTGEDDEDADLGAILVHPTQIISVESIEDRLLDMINEACDRLGIGVN